MMVARWCIEARFGHKQTVIVSLKKWNREIGSLIGWTEYQLRIVTGSIGALESRIELEVLIEDLAELSASWANSAPSKRISSGVRISNPTLFLARRIGKSFVLPSGHRAPR